MGNTRTLLKRISTGIPVLADLVDGEIIGVEDTGLIYQRINATTLITLPTKPVTYTEYTVATLPTGSGGDIAYVTDGTTPTYLGTAVGGGAVVAPVFHNGTEWVFR